MASDVRPALRWGSVRGRRVSRIARIATLLLALSACGSPEGTSNTDGTNERAAAQREEVEAPRTVRTVRPTQGTLEATRSVSATVRPLQDAIVASNASGRVERVEARPGDLVAAGDPVVITDDTQATQQLRTARLSLRQAEIELERASRANDESAAQARASLRAAESNVAALRDRVADLEALVAAGGAARRDLSDLRVQLEQAESQAVQARDALARARRGESEDVALLALQLERAQVQVEQAEDAVEDTLIVAPFTGEVAELYLEVGEQAAPGVRAFRLQSVDAREIVLDVPPEDAARLRATGTVTLRYAGRELPAEIVASSRQAERPRQVRLTGRIEADDASDLPNGVVGEVRYRLPLAEGMRIPSGAIAAEAGGTWVYLVRDGVATRVAVEVLAEAGGTAAVRGLDEDDVVIHPRPLDVREGSRVQVAP
ncbi:MAG: HlyD family efflux transporter periplasmic adaptor subunit [Trueperaceae bacterium]|nr:HlyD family efflux transporter periplasmic adaptor subunit [Trueperaceae bacterium]